MWNLHAEKQLFVMKVKNNLIQRCEYLFLQGKIFQTVPCQDSWVHMDEHLFCGTP